MDKTVKSFTDKSSMFNASIVLVRHYKSELPTFQNLAKSFLKSKKRQIRQLSKQGVGKRTPLTSVTRVNL